jgi:potassium/hydrogen antiporter
VSDGGAVLAAAVSPVGGRLELLLLAGALVVLVAALAVRVSTRLGLPSLLLYLGIGLAMGESGIGIQFSDAGLTRTLGVCALLLILAEGGLTTRWQAVRGAVPTALSLATVGVLVAATVTGAAATLALGLDWRSGLLLGAIVSSTDAAAVFSALRRLTLRRRVAATVELESGLNDPLAVILVVLLSAEGARSWLEVAALTAYELVAGGLLGAGVGWLGARFLRRAALPAAGLYPLATVSIAVLSFAVASLAHASGFAAVYLAGLVLGNSALPHRQATLGFAEGVAWLAQIGLFVLLGLLASPSRMPGVLLPALVVGGVLLLVARPLSVLVSMAPFRLPLGEQVFLSWAGLRGAVPIVLATIPVTAGLPGGLRLFDIVFVLVVVFTLVQGTTLPLAARLTGAVATGETREIEVESAPLAELHADLLQMQILARSRLHGVYVSELRLPRGAVLSLVVRDGGAFVPEPNTRLVRGDQLLVMATREARERAERRLRALSRAGRHARWLGERGDPDRPHRDGAAP